jgi:preprotein translocase subunit SecG
MYIFFTVIVVLAAVFMIGIVLVQNSKGGGLAAGFSSSNSIMGVRKTTDFVEKATWYAVGILIVFSIATVAVKDKTADAGGSQVTQEALQDVQTTQPGAVTPGFGETAEPVQPAQPQQ